jgi:hypothetical protein
MPARNGRNPVLARLSLLLLVGVAGCSASPGQAPILAGKTSDSPVVAMVEGRGVEQLVRPILDTGNRQHIEKTS